MKQDRFYIENSSQFDGQVVTIKGWVYNKRSSGKIKFLVVRDGTGMLQAVLFKGDCNEEAFTEFDRLTQESSVSFAKIPELRENTN
jgi:asparaginyl-tRNA synthetase